MEYKTYATDVRAGREGAMTAFDLSPDGDGTLVVVGEIDSLTAPALEPALKPLIDSGGTVILDMRRVTFMDSSGLRAILAATQALKGRGRLVLRNPQPIVVRVLEVTGLMPAPDGMPLEVQFDTPFEGDGQAPATG
jgi:anti-anti-sigma factor